MILSSQAIRERGIFKPFSERAKFLGMTYGVGPAGYDVRIREALELPPGGFSLASTVEEFDMPHDLLGIVHDKSTWARMGLALQNTVIEPGWRGVLTIELSNHGKSLLKFEPGQPIAQIILHVLDRPTEQPYAGKYQDQKPGAQAAILEK